MEKRIAVTLYGITQSVLESELAFYTRAGYTVAEEAPAEVVEEAPTKKAKSGK